MHFDSLRAQGICRLCPRCNSNTQRHYLNERLLASYCECDKVGGLYLGISQTPYWKLFDRFSKDEFFNYASSARAYVDCIKDVASNPNQVLTGI